MKRLNKNLGEKDSIKEIMSRCTCTGTCTCTTKDSQFINQKYYWEIQSREKSYERPEAW